MSAAIQRSKPKSTASALQNLKLPVSIAINDRIRMEINDGTSLRMLIDLVNRLENIAAIKEGLDDVSAGRTISLDQFKQKARQKNGT